MTETLPATPPRQIAVRDLVQQIRAAVERMSVSNPHRALFIQCGHALVELAKRSHQSTESPT